MGSREKAPRAEGMLVDHHSIGALNFMRRIGTTISARLAAFILADAANKLHIRRIVTSEFTMYSLGTRSRLAVH